MDIPTTLQPQGGVAQQPQDQPIPAVLALTKAIGKAETGGSYNAVGDGGNSQGAYQMSPAFIQKWASDAGVQYQPGQQLDPETQNRIAYSAVKTMGSKGDPGYSYLGKLSPAQIASAWNAGDPNAYLDPEYGKNNAYGSTANYVTEVQKNYEKELGTQPQNPLGIATANAASSPSGNTSSSGGPSAMDWLLGGAGALGGWLLAKGGTYLKNAAADVATDAALGAVGGTAVEPGGGTLVGGLGGVGVGLLQAGIQTAIGGGGGDQNNPPQAVSSPSSGQNPQQDILAELQSLEAGTQQANQASRQLSQTQQRALETTIGGRQMMQDPQVQAGMEANAKYGFSPEIDETGSMNWQPAMQKSQKTVSGLASGIQQVLMAEGGVAPIDFAVEQAKQHLRNSAPSNEWEEGDKEIDKAAASYAKNFSDGKGNMSLGHFQQMKQELGHGKKWNILETTAKKQALKSLSLGARRTIEHHTQHKELYNRAMKEEQKLINGQKIMKRLNGKKAPKNEGLLKHILHSGGKYASLYIGDKIGGPLGAILGSMAGDYVTKAVDKKYGKSIFETPAMHKAIDLLQKQNPAAYELLTYQLRKAGISFPKKHKLSRAQSSKAKLTFRPKGRKTTQIAPPTLQL